MSCYFPLLGLPTGDYTEKGKPRYLIKSIHDYRKASFNFAEWSEKWSKAHNGLTPILIPCRKCIGCKLEYSRQWADRCMLELKYHMQSCFLTLTYDDNHLKNINGDSLKEGEHASLYLRDFQLFMKRLRKEYEGTKVRYYMCGEYGSESFRPHYHIILFGIDFTDRVFYKRTKQGFYLFNSPCLSKLWNNGHAVIGDVDWDSCAYVARYTAKKMLQDSDIFIRWNVLPEFTQCSLGIISRKAGFKS